MADEYVRMRKSTLTGMCDAVREVEGSTELIPPLEMPERIKALASGGLERYAYTLQLYSLNLLGKSKVEIDLPNARTLSKLCDISSDRNDSRKNTVVEELTVNCPNFDGAMAFFLCCGNCNIDEKLKRVVINADTAGTTQFNYSFSKMSALESIEGTPLDMSNVQQTQSCFDRCNALREVRFKGGIAISLDISDSTKLSKESIISAISNLKDTATGYTLTLSQTAVDTAFETSEGAADGSTSAEWLALVEAHSNWTISLV